MSSSFYANPCKLDADTIVTQLAWSNIDPIAAVACNTVDDRDRETHQILFINNEVRLHQIIYDDYSWISLILSLVIQLSRCSILTCLSLLFHIQLLHYYKL
jgi:hypothetical protein